MLRRMLARKEYAKVLDTVYTLEFFVGLMKEHGYEELESLEILYALLKDEMTIVKARIDEWKG